jgi:hypothetical protein
VFVVGCPRSGTTLVQRMLDSHPLLAVANDTHFIPRALAGEGVGPGVDPPLTPALVERVRTYHRFPRLGLSDEAVSEAARGSRTYGELVVALYSRLAARRGKPLAGEKTPDYVRHLPLLANLFPWSKIVHVIRDGRDVALSALGWAREDKGPGRYELWRTEPVAVCALWWRWLVDSGRRDGAGLAGSYRELRYEDLVADPDPQLRATCEYLDLPFAPEMARYFEGRTRSDPGLSAKRAWLPPTTGLRNWRREMDARDVQLFEAIAGDLLAELGYPRRFETVSPQIVGLAERCTAWWGAEMERRRQKEAGLGREVA